MTLEHWLTFMNPMRGLVIRILQLLALTTTLVALPQASGILGVSELLEMT